MDRQQSNLDLLEKADLRLANLASGGLLVEEQANKFVRLLIEQAVIMKEALVTPMKSHAKVIDKIRFANRILRAGQESTALPEADRSRPDLSKTELNAKLFKAEVDLSYETLEDTLERKGFADTVMQIMAEAVSRDMDDVIINGDTTSADPFFAQFDGLLVQANSNVLNAQNNTLNKKVLRQLYKTLPDEWKRNKQSMMYLTSPNAATDWTDSVSDRQTALGDQKFLRGAQSQYNGIPVREVPLFPDTITSTVPSSSVNTTNVILTDTKNINVGIWRQIMMEKDRDIRSGEYIIVVTVRFDMKLIEALATAKAINVAFAGL